jgi:gamma-glutamylcyclotransferase (GGCT)/AIG2-like uncharacterized protein YtfP
MSNHRPEIENASPVIFVYGTLMRGYKLYRYLKRAGATYLGTGRIRAKLFELPEEEFPAAIPDDHSYTVGELYRLQKPRETLAELDRLEECDEGLFERKLVDVLRPAGHQKAWTYFYQRPLRGAREVPSGDYRQLTKQPLASP